jgi:hypothetical protein
LALVLPPPLSSHGSSRDRPYGPHPFRVSSRRDETTLDNYGEGVMAESEEIQVVVVHEKGRKAIRCIYINHHRIVGRKPYVSENLPHDHYSVSEADFEKGPHLTSIKKLREIERDRDRLKRDMGEICKDANPDWLEKRVDPIGCLDDIHADAVASFYFKPTPTIEGGE